MKTIYRCIRALAFMALMSAASAQDGGLFAPSFELGVLDYRLMLFVTQSAPLVQQFSGVTAAASLPLASRELWKGGGIAWTAGLESGLSFDSTGICRYSVRLIEVDRINASGVANETAPNLRPGLLFGAPLYVPIRFRTGAEILIVPGWRVECAVECAIVLLFYALDCVSWRSDFGLTLGSFFSIGGGRSLGFRLRSADFGDAADRWGGFGLSVNMGFAQGGGK